MALIINLGKSGSGKSYAMRNLPPEKTLVVNTIGKDFPFKSSFKYVLNSSEVNKMTDQITKAVNSGKVKIIVLDDIGYVFTTMFMSRHRNMKGNQSFELYNDIADTMWNLINFLKNLPRDVNVYMNFHEDTNDYGATKIKTIGKLLDDKVCIEGMVTIVLRFMSADGKHFVRTVTDGNDIVKSPVDLFPQDEMDNDLLEIDNCIRAFYGTQLDADKKEEQKEQEVTKNDKTATV